MNILSSKAALNKTLLRVWESNISIGLVPTMGALHEGHLALVKRALAENELAVVSIFVNPTQFNNAGDLEKYPRTLETDIARLKTVSPNILVFNPPASDLYDGNVVSTPYNFGGLENEMEGKHRTGHFDGVGTVLNLLFRTVKPTRAYFGEKDFQQLQIVRKLVEIESLPVEVVGCDIVREPNGVAMSSRNKRLTKVQFEAASLISETLSEVKEHFDNLSIPKLEALAHSRFEDHPILRLEYFEIANTRTLKTAKRKRKGNTYRAFTAVFAGEVRLIDNMALN